MKELEKKIRKIIKQMYKSKDLWEIYQLNIELNYILNKRLKK